MGDTDARLFRADPTGARFRRLVRLRLTAGRRGWRPNRCLGSGGLLVEDYEVGRSAVLPLRSNTKALSLARASASKAS